MRHDREAAIHRGDIMQKWLCICGMMAVLLVAPISASAQEFQPQADIDAALSRLGTVAGGLGGMGGLGIIPEHDLQVIQGMLDESERMIRQARLRMQETEGDMTPQAAAWISGYARAGEAMIMTVEDFLKDRGYR